jgi:hypothetical protein
MIHFTTTAPIGEPCEPFSSYFPVPLPRGLRDHTAGMSWVEAVEALGPSSGPLRLGNWECTDVRRSGRRLGPQPRSYQATIAVGDTIGTATSDASGPVAALTDMLYQRGIAMETLRFHQLRSGEQTVTFVLGSDGSRQAWAMGSSDDPIASSLRAVIACANRLLTA